MGSSLEMRDETMSGKVLYELSIEMAQVKASMTIAEIIELRVRYETALRNSENNLDRPTLIRPSDLERELGFGHRRTIDANQQVAVALKAFSQNQILVLVNNRQASELSDEVVVDFDTTIAFVRLVPLVGG
jgi:hypothetical protein